MEHLTMMDSAVHRLDARVKIVLMATFMVLVSLAPANWRFLPAILFPVTLLVISRVPPVYLLKRTALVLPFVFAVIIFMPFLPGEKVLYTSSLFGHDLEITEEGLTVCVSVLSKATVCMLTLLVLVATTRFALILKALYAMKVPVVLVMLISFLYRYLFVLFDQALRMKRARDSRLVRRRHHSVKERLSVAAGMIGSLFLRTYTRAERVYDSMLARGFSGEMHSMTEWRTGWHDAVFAVVSIGFFVFLGILWMDLL